ncbi:uncharacterized protein LOC126992190, partial [Eriocheir sinensis]|uniref:uncharacterized protein LOC126992190 n=1 Tax=Eriocheir sinensis TaxID=95602 RepID=UPI0021C5DB0D
MTPTQWLAIPTDIILTKFPPKVPLVQDASDVLPINGKKMTVKQEPASPTETTETAIETTDTAASSVPVSPMKSQLCTSHDGETKFMLEYHAASLATAAAAQLKQANIIIVTSRPKNPDYKVREFTVATKRSRPVNFKLLLANVGVRLSISLTYQGHIYGDKPVKRCKKHDECSWCEDHKYNEAFCIISKFHHYELDPKGNPTAILTPQVEHLDTDGSIQFSVVFACWNSCDIHVPFGKEMTLHIEITHNGDVKKVEYNIQCCQNLLRDAFKDRKRKLFSQSENTQENPSKASAASSKTSSTSSSSSKLSLKASTKASLSCPPTSPPTSPTRVKKEKAVDIVV